MCDLPKVVVELDNDRESINFSLYRNINVLSDRSGKGKTNMVSKLLRVLNNYGNISIYGYYEGQKVDYTLVPISNIAQIGDYDDFKCYILDDLKSAFFDEKAHNLYTKANKSVFLFISRGSTVGYRNRYVAFADAVYNLEYNKVGKKEYFSLNRIKDVFNNINPSDIDVGSIETCLCEGENGYAEDMLYSSLFNKVVCSEGRHNVSSKLDKISRSFSKGSSLFVVVDLCGFGGCLEEFINEYYRSDLNIILADVLSFEYMMLESLFPEKFVEVSKINTDYINGKTFEKYVSSVLFNIRFGFCNWFSKEKVPVSLVNGCYRCNKFKKSKCNMCSSLEDRIVGMCKNSEEFSTIVLASNLGGFDYAQDIIGFYGTTEQ